MTARTHAPRRTPAAPAETLDLHDAADQLLIQARGLAAQRSARTLTPGAGAPVKQTLLALAAGRRLEDHVAPGPTTLQGLVGHARVHHGSQTIELPEGSWATCPTGQHTVEALTDAVVLLTVAPAHPAQPHT